MSGETFVRAALRPVQTNVAGGQGKVGPVRAPRRGKENRRASSVVQPARGSASVVPVRRSLTELEQRLQLENGNWARRYDRLQSQCQMTHKENAVLKHRISIVENVARNLQPRLQEEDTTSVERLQQIKDELHAALTALRTAESCGSSDEGEADHQQVNCEPERPDSVATADISQ
ncbi:hypothetical protein PBRA_003623 [Plasmodiophora brassicae]|uniref:Uncharacterized protein n=1 Tax=Plasmodiophora brassicae TaxID=37360 RepID=A0A0G4IIA5_PLABS|nr:hypothetical protein PBRA_003623 [Plasmodiophora brassicae]